MAFEGMSWDDFFEENNITDPGAQERLQRFGAPEDIPEQNLDALGLGGESGATGGGDIQVGSTSGGEGGDDGSGGLGGFQDWLDSRLEPWYDETDPIRDQFRSWLDVEGVSPGDEGFAAHSAESAAERAAGGAAGSGMLYSGVQEGAMQGLWQGASRDILRERRGRMEGAGGILSGLSGQLAGLLGREMGAGASAYGADRGVAPFAGQWGRKESDIAKSEYERDLEIKRKEAELGQVSG